MTYHTFFVYLGMRSTGLTWVCSMENWEQTSQKCICLIIRTAHVLSQLCSHDGHQWGKEDGNAGIHWDHILPIGQYSQHHSLLLDYPLTILDFMQNKYPLTNFTFLTVELVEGRFITPVNIGLSGSLTDKIKWSKNVKISSNKCLFFIRQLSKIILCFVIWDF